MSGNRYSNKTWYEWAEIDANRLYLFFDKQRGGSIFIAPLSMSARLIKFIWGS